MREAGCIKCIVWDLDNTLWNGILLEDVQVVINQNVVDIIKTLDERGILQSIASKNDADAALDKLRELGLDSYFLYPQINWHSKAVSIKSIVNSINIGLDAVAFIDDQQFELDEVKHAIPEVMCIDARDLSGLLAMPEMSPRFITEDSRLRRLMYRSDLKRKKAEEEFVGPQESFLATLCMQLKIGPAREEDLRRAEELTVRTNQLNTTGYTYSYDQLCEFLHSGHHRLLIASLTDKYGSYGKIGLALLECDEPEWIIKLLLMSCRVMSRGVGTIMINYIMQLAAAAGVRLRAEFISNDRNRMMYVTYKFANFKEVAREGKLVILENDLSRLQALPDYMRIELAS
jgi:FkbH-like protein